MRNKHLILALTGAVIFGLLGVVLVTRYLSNAQAYTKSLNNVVVAKVPIPLGAKIMAEQLTTASMPNGSAPEGAFTAAEKVVGRIAVVNIGVREAVTTSKLAAEGAAGGLSAVIPEGYRAMTVKVDDVVGISGFIMPGALVDIVAVITPSEQGTSQNPISKIVLQNIKVLANGQNIDRPKSEREPESVKAVTLQVTPDQAEKLALAANEGKLQLVMRNYGDLEDAATRGANKQSLLAGDSYVALPVTMPKTEQPQPQASAPVSRPRPRPLAAQRPEVARQPAPPAQAAAPPPPRNTVEAIEGAKKRSIDLP